MKWLLLKFNGIFDNETLPKRGEPGYHRLGKVRTVFGILKYNPHQQSSTDKVMVPYKGCPKNPVKRGFKVWMRGDAVNGYVSEIYVYTGKGERIRD